MIDIEILKFKMYHRLHSTLNKIRDRHDYGDAVDSYNEVYIIVDLLEELDLITSKESVYYTREADKLLHERKIRG